MEENKKRKREREMWEGRKRRDCGEMERAYGVKGRERMYWVEIERERDKRREYERLCGEK